MKIEHIGFNVTHPTEMGEWYAENFDLKIVHKLNIPPYNHYLANEHGAVMLELYYSPTDEVLDFLKMDPLVVHIAFATDDPDGDKRNLISAGATLLNENHFEDNSLLITMRDPWGFPFQLCRRSLSILKKMIK
ncbi:MAG: VOC family protein [Opitutaceae bacterium]|nr:VOC family protein [Opitutaceae bacterium]